jgi:hypothetical protein
MSKPDPTGFGKFVPGFEFLQNLGKGASASLPAMDHWNKWVAPTLDPQALDKRIEELKAVQFWLDQNATALKATIQALEVQKLTLATLKGMNFHPSDLAQVFKPAAAAAPAPSQSAKTAASRKPRAAPKAAPASTQPDPMQFWGALTQQFQQIASQAMKEVASKAAMAPKNAIKKEAPTAAKTSPSARKATKQGAARRR